MKKPAFRSFSSIYLSYLWYDRGIGNFVPKFLISQLDLVHQDGAHDQSLALKQFSYVGLLNNYVLKRKE